jgi:pimeloyl-ACP methyl ester carboxylesterase
MLLVMGLGGQLVSWPDDLCGQFVDAGFFVIRFDNRDAGLSEKVEGTSGDPEAMFSAALVGERLDAPYYLWDLAADAVGLLDHLEVDAGHVVGVSMGGMIAQEMAIGYPERLLSLTSIMSTTGSLAVGQPTPEALDVLLAGPPSSREEAIESAVKAFRVIGSKTHFDEELVREQAARSYDRSVYPEGVERQLAAVLASGDRTERLRTVRVPTLVIHGEQDALIDISGGEATAAAIPGAKFVPVREMGHDLPRVVWPKIVAEITEHARRSTSD